MTRVDDADVAHRVFHALELERAVYYLQETLPHGGRDLRALVVGGRVLAAIERVGSGWRANLARGARARPTELSAEQERLCLEAAAVAGGRLRGRRPAARRRRARVRARAQRDPRLARAAGGDGRRRGGGARRARGDARQRSSASSRGPMTPRCSAVATSAPAAPASRERAQVAGVAHAAAGEQLEVWEGGVELGDQPDVRPRAAAHARQVEHDRLAQARRGAGARPRRARGRPASCGSGDSTRPSRRSTLRTTAPSGSSASSRSSASAPVSVSVPTMTRCAPRSEQRPRPLRLADAGVDHDARLARQRGDASRVARLAPPIASRSATYSSSSPSSARNARASASGSPSSPPMTLWTGR